MSDRESEDLHDDVQDMFCDFLESKKLNLENIDSDHIRIIKYYVDKAKEDLQEDIKSRTLNRPLKISIYNSFKLCAEENFDSWQQFYKHVIDNSFVKIVMHS